MPCYACFDSRTNTCTLMHMQAHLAGQREMHHPILCNCYVTGRRLNLHVSDVTVAVP
ncbi:hypothetical protein BGZ61DRAFT_458191 [Ilyonectria robusta]|uniref:uncharacterized protein n=1 Tax=Ilyonectria robusta TaxID=1079257 RepID=UPI001E8CA692|nr:uncharacterized protein BGZ61DRAFT_458191 [Ilyonectria robusta]KAH8675027.1 hypothetical protein BGZ61DRAFT_458191 [Ilyonectria robusta]